MAEIRPLLSDATAEDTVKGVNRIFGILKGTIGGQFYLADADGVSRDIRGGATLSTGNYTLKIRSGAGNHLQIRRSDDSEDVLRVNNFFISMDQSIVISGTSSGTGRRIFGDFTNATLRSRVMFLTSTAGNQPTSVGAVPAGTNTTADFTAFNDSNPDTASGAAVLRATATAIEIRADSPNASYKPLDFYTGGSSRMRIDENGYITLSSVGGRIGLFGGTPATKPASYLQTYAVADRTFSAYTANVQSSAYGGIATGAGGLVYAGVSDVNTLRLAYENLRAFSEDMAGIVNSLVDDHQALGMA